MARYASFVDLTDREIQNVQELASVWGEIRTEFEEHEAQLQDAYAVLGEHDFLVLFSAPDRESAYKCALTIGRHGLETNTTELIDTDEFASLVDEV